MVMDDKNCISPDKILKLVAQLADLVKGSLGEDGEAVMINIRSPRQIVVTKVIKVTCTQWQLSFAFNFTFTLTLTSVAQHGLSNSLELVGQCTSAGLK